MTEEKQKENLLKKGGKWGAIIGAAWIGLNIVIPLAAAPYPAIFFPCLIKFITKFLSLLLTS